MRLPSSAPRRPERDALRPDQIAIVALIVGAWLVAGLIGHDPWKPDEAYTFGIVYSMLQTGDWVTPMLTGEPYLVHPPLFYVVAALFANMFSPLLPVHDAARLASGFFSMLTLSFVALCARELYGRSHGVIAAIILIGCVGLLVRAHQIIVDVALLAGSAIALYGMALSLRRPLAAAVITGSGVGLAFLAHGIYAPIVFALLLMLLPLLFSNWRTSRFALFFGLALAAAAPWLAIWPYALHLRTPSLFEAWLLMNNIDLLDLNISETLYYLTILPWYAWPALPLALWTLWNARRGGFAHPGIQLPLICFVVMLLALSTAAEPHEVYALPLLLPLALLASYSTYSLRRGAVNALDWFGIMTFGLAAVLLWLGWLAVLTGFPAVLAARLARQLPDYYATFSAWAFAISLFFSFAWLALVARIGRSSRRAFLNWAGGITLVWVMAMTLWLPFIDTVKSYRGMLSAMANALPANYECMTSIGLGESQRAMLHYFSGIVAQRVERNGDTGDCPLLLIQTTPEDPMTPGNTWQKIWEGNRPGDRNERYRLYQRAAG